MCGGLKINGKMVISHKECLSVLWYACVCKCVCAFDYVYLNRCKCVYESATLRYSQEKNKMKTIVQCIKLFHWHFEYFKASKKAYFAKTSK